MTFIDGSKTLRYLLMGWPSELSLIFGLTTYVFNFISFLQYNDLRFWYIGKFLVMVWMAILTSSSFSVALPGPTATSTIHLWSLRGDLAKDYFCIIASRGLWIYKHISPKSVLVKLLTPIDYGKRFSFNVGIVFFSWCWNYIIVCLVLSYKELIWLQSWSFKEDVDQVLQDSELN